MPPVASPGFLADSPSARRAQLGRVRFRRALTLLVMTLFLPGSAQLVAGRKQVGRIAIRVWLALVATVVLVAVVGLVWPGFVFWLVSNTFVLGLVRVLLFAAAIGWAGLFVDAWRLGQPLGLRQKQRLAMVGLNGFLCLTVAGSLLFASHVVGVQRNFMVTMFGDGVASAAEHGRYNVLLLGGDSGFDRWGLRADSINVASIDEVTGRTILFGLPRNMQNFPFAEGSVMAQQFPNGFDCEGCYLNSLNTWTADHPDLFRDSDQPGIDATTAAVEGITGLKINYYAMVDLRGFEALVDALGGVRLKVRDRIPIGGVGGPVTGYIEPGTRVLDGFHTLWFARSRETADDYSRMARQKCVMNAMLEQLSPKTVVTKFEEIADASKKVVTTDLPASEVDTFIDLALKAKSQPVSTVSFVPPLVNTADPDIQQIQQRVQHAIDASQDRAGTDAPRAKGNADKAKAHQAKAAVGGADTQAERPTTGGAIGSLSEGYVANQADNLDSAC